jgi:hypothetical protein
VEVSLQSPLRTRNNEVRDFEKLSNRQVYQGKKYATKKQFDYSLLTILTLEKKALQVSGMPNYYLYNDNQGSTIYGEIPAEEADEKGSLIEENGAYTINRFNVTSTKAFYRPVHGELMIRFTCYTKIAPVSNSPSTFPKYIYRLTPFDQIESFVNDSKDFLGKKISNTHILAMLFYLLIVLS